MSKRKPLKIGFWTMVRDVLIASMSKGQFPVALCAIIVIIVILRIPEETVAELAKSTFEKFVSGYLFGYGAAVFLGFGWFFHVRFQRRIMTHEVTRISEEKTELQKQLINSPLGSSNDS